MLGASPRPSRPKSRHGRSRLIRLRGRGQRVESFPIAVALAALAVYAVWIGAFLLAGHEPRDFIKIGPNFVQQSDTSARIRLDPSYRYPRNHDPSFRGAGYDGQFSYYMALDFHNARYYMDVPPYRYSRVLYPVAARVLALDQPAALPFTMILVNWIAIGGGTFFLAAWLKRRRASPWWALGFALFPGMFLAMQRDLTEPLAYSLAAAGIWALDRPGRRTVLLAGVIFGLAGLARQTTVVFPLCFAAALWLRGSRRDALMLVTLSIAPIGAYTVLLHAWLGAGGAGPFLQPVPFLGLFEGPWTASGKSPNLIAVVLPALLFAAAVLAVIRRGGWRTALFCFLLNALLFVALVRPDLYLAWTALGRQSCALLLVAVLCVPYLAHGPRWATRVAQVAGALWMGLLPVIAVYGFIGGTA